MSSNILKHKQFLSLTTANNVDNVVYTVVSVWMHFKTNNNKIDYRLSNSTKRYRIGHHNLSFSVCRREWKYVSSEMCATNYQTHGWHIGNEKWSSRKYFCYFHTSPSETTDCFSMAINIFQNITVTLFKNPGKTRVFISIIQKTTRGCIFTVPAWVFLIPRPVGPKLRSLFWHNIRRQKRRKNIRFFPNVHMYQPFFFFYSYNAF